MSSGVEEKERESALEVEKVRVLFKVVATPATSVRQDFPVWNTPHSYWSGVRPRMEVDLKGD